MIESKRTDLSKAFPLPVPFSVILEPTNLCNFRCTFCPTGDPDLLKRFKVPKGSMNMKLYEKICQSIKQMVEQAGNLRLKKFLLYKDGEPLVHPDFPLMVALAKKYNISEEVWTTSNGALLNPELNERLVNSGLDGIRISITALDEQGYKDLTCVKLDFKTLVENIRHLHSIAQHTKVIVKMIDAKLSEEQKKKFIDIFSNITDGCFFEEVTGWSLSKEKDFTLGEDIEKVIAQRSKKGKQVCASPFYSLAVNFNGLVSACCVDWAYQTIVGDLKNESFSQVWHGEKLKAFRRMHLLKQRQNNKACKNCDYMATHPDYLDPYADEMLARL